MAQVRAGKATAPVNPLNRLLGYQLRRASVAMMANLTADLSTIALRPTEASVLLLIEANPGITQSAIGNVLGIKRANMAPLTASLVDRGLIDRTAADGRSHCLRLSKAGANLARAAARRMDRLEASALAGLSSKARASLIDQLRMIWGEEED